MKVLELNFMTSGGKTAKISIDEPLEPVNTEQVKAAMQSIIEAGVFIDSDGNSYEEMKAARLVERTVTEYSLD